MVLRVIRFLPLLLLAPIWAAAEETDGSRAERYMDLSGKLPDDAFVAAETINSNAEIDGDLFAAGRTVTVDGKIGDLAAIAGWRIRLGGEIVGDVLTAGFTVDADGNFGDNLVASGAFITLDGRVAGKAVLYSFEVFVSRNAEIGENARLAASLVELAGRVHGNAQIAGANVVIRGQIDGDVDIIGDDVEILPSAIIGGDLTHRGPNAPRIAPGARIDGDIRHIEQSGIEKIGRQAELIGFASSLFVPIYFFLLGLLIYFLAPGFVATTAHQLRTDPLASVGLGLLILLGTPVVIILLSITLIGMPFAFLLGAFFGVSALLAGPLVGLSVSHMVMRTRGKDRSRAAIIGGFAAFIIAWWLIDFIPIVGSLASIIMIAAGLGIGGFEIFRFARARHQPV